MKPFNPETAVIYWIKCIDPNIPDEYIGSTTNFKGRTNTHKSDCTNEKSKKYNLYVYKFIRENGGWENWSLIPNEEYPCENVNQALIRERYWVETLQAELNKQIPSRNKKEYCEINKNNICEKSKKILWKK